MNANSVSRHRHAEDGYALLFAIFLLALFTISLSLAMPVVIRQIQLDRERETMERGQQYRRAVQLYFRKFHAYPPTIDALVETNNIRFLRKKYVDPMTGNDDWHPILWGQNKVPTAMGFFGEPLNGSGAGSSTLAGIGPSGGNGRAILPVGIGKSSFGSTPSSFSSGIGATPGNPSSTGISTPGNTAPGSSNQDPSSGFGTNSEGQSFGGAGIIGFSPGSPRQSVMLYKKKDHFNEWEFTYDPMSDPQFAQVNAQLEAAPGAGLVGSAADPNGTGPVVSQKPSTTAQ